MNSRPLVDSRALLFLAAVFALMTTAARASAAPPRRLAVVPSIVQGRDPPPSTEVVFDVLARRASFRLGVDVLPYTEVFVDGAESLASGVLGCGSEVPCMARVLRTARAELLVRATLNLALEPPLVTLVLVDPRSERRLAEVTQEARGRAGPPAPEGARLGAGLEKILGRLTDEVLDAIGLARGGVMDVDLQPSDASFTLGRCLSSACDRHEQFAFEGPPRTRFAVPAGRYRVAAQKEGFGARAVLVDVILAREVRVEFVLDPEHPEAHGEGQRLLDRPWFWAVLGGAVTVVGASIALVATQPFNTPEPTGCVCLATMGTECPPCPR